MSKKGEAVSGKTGQFRSPMAGYLANPSPNLSPSIAPQTTITGSAPKAAPIQSPMAPYPVNKGRKSHAD